MFWQAEDVQPAVKAVAEVFGKVGAMETGKNVLYNVSIFSRQYGKLWYGDLINDGIRVTTGDESRTSMTRCLCSGKQKMFNQQ